MKNIIQRMSMAILLSLALLFAKSAKAYQEDTHFIMTFILCRSAGFTQQEALIIAAVDQGMDDSPGTVANGGLVGAIPNMNEEWLWHALDMSGNMGAPGVLTRKEELFNITLQQNDMRNKLVWLGVFFHYQQDTWAHRDHLDSNHLSMNAYKTYDTPFGHASDVNQPDRPPFDPVCALMCLEDGLRYACDFLRRGLGRTPNPFFNGYKPMGGTIDNTWKSGKKGVYFNQVDWQSSKADSTSARHYLVSLIRTQIDQYTASINPPYVLNITADAANFNTMRKGLQKLCDAFAPMIGAVVIPSKEDKLSQEYNILTSVDLFALKNAVAMLSGEFYIKIRSSGRYLCKDSTGDNFINTKAQPAGNLSVFILEPQADGTYRVRLKSDSLYLHVDGCDSRHCLNTKLQSEEDDLFGRFIFETQLENSEYRIKLCGNGRYLGEDITDNKIFSAAISPKNDLTKFILEKR